MMAKRSVSDTEILRLLKAIRAGEIALGEISSDEELLALLEAERNAFDEVFVEEGKAQRSDLRIIPPEEINVEPRPDRYESLMQHFRDFRAALKMIREAIEEAAPPGSVPNDEYIGPEPGEEAEALVMGIVALKESKDAAARSAALAMRDAALKAIQDIAASLQDNRQASDEQKAYAEARLHDAIKAVSAIKPKNL